MGIAATHQVMAQPSSEANNAAYNTPSMIAGANSDSKTNDYSVGHVASNDGTPASQNTPAVIGGNKG